MPIRCIFPVRALSLSCTLAGLACASRSASLPLDSPMHFCHGVINPFEYSTPSMIAYNGALIRTLLVSSWLSGRMSCYRYSTIGFIHVCRAGIRVCIHRSSILLTLSTSTRTFLDRLSKHVDASLLRASALLFSCLGIFLMVNSLRGSKRCCMAFTYFSIRLYLTSNSPLI